MTETTGLLRAIGVQAVTLVGAMQARSLAWNIAQTKMSGCEIVQVRRTGKGCLSCIIASDREAVVIDASLDPDVYLRMLRERGWRLRAVADTHLQADRLPPQLRVRFTLRSGDEGQATPRRAPPTFLAAAQP